MLTGLSLLLALQASTADRDPSWGNLYDWTAKRYGTGACVAGQETPEGTDLLRVAADGSATLFISRAQWRTNPPKRTFVFQNSDNERPKRVLVNEPVRGGELGRGLYIDLKKIEPLAHYPGVALLPGPDGSGDMVGDYYPKRLYEVAAALRTCVRALAAEQASKPASSGDAVRPLLFTSDYVGVIDYPDDARRAHATGKASFDLDIAEDGYPEGCTVTQSSGNASLDTATCALARRRLRFAPRLDASGKPVRQSYAGAFTWNLPAG